MSGNGDDSFKRVIDRITGCYRGRGPSKTGATQWFEKHATQFAAWASQADVISWSSVANALTDEGYMGRAGERLTGPQAHSTWQRVLRRNRLEAQAAAQSKPTRKAGRGKSLGVIIAGLISCGIAAPASAQMPTISVAELAQAIETVMQLKQVYSATAGTLGSLQRGINLDGIASAAGNALPDAGQIGSAITGGGGLGPLSGLLGQYRDRNTYYRPEGGGYTADMLERGSNSYASTQAMSERQIAAIEERLAVIDDLKSQLSTVTSQADLTAIQGQIAAEQAYLAGLTAQGNSIGNLMGAQRGQFEQIGMQKFRKDADDLLAWAQGGTSDTGTPTRQVVDVPTYRGF